MCVPFSHKSKNLQWLWLQDRPRLHEIGSIGPDPFGPEPLFEEALIGSIAVCVLHEIGSKVDPHPKRIIL